MGPVADIPLREPLTANQADELEQWLRSITSRLEGERLDWWPFWIKDGRLIGLPFADCSAACAFGLAVEDTKTEQDYREEDGSIDPAIRAELEEARAQTLVHLGYHPKQSINIYAGCKGKLDHRILGHLAVHLAERYDGIINMDGAITPPLRPGGRYELDNYPWHTLEEISAFVRPMPGRVFEQYYTTSAGDRWVSHMVDTTFLRAWLQHPHFHMIK